MFVYRDIVCCYWFEEWCELHVYDHYQDSNRPSRSGRNSTGSTTWFHSQKVNSEERLFDPFVVVALVVVDRGEDLE